ncbi:MAG: hypothetical protein KBT77_03020 [Thalassolituus oleivorans]|uniref:Imm50 family immunity protein n=1 Tax=Thalassolituus oleivorans TaxID=187493 RepID=UPI001B562BB3|nr:Imm50 family immunity protein [Thalassolituus oleivorans]MBQ0726306.1 hypothetical protein [Thalassolituus oleivorans]
MENSIEVESIYGYWPSFHDAEILSIRFTRALSSNEKTASAVVDLNYWETKAINEGTSAFDYVLDKDNVISIEFSGLVASSVSGFNFQNVIDELILTKVAEGIKAEFISIHGAEVNFVCNAVAVVGVRANA